MCIRDRSNRGKATGIKTTHQITHELKKHITPIFLWHSSQFLNVVYLIPEKVVDRILCNKYIL